jgi:hypothetical protein
VFHLRYYDRKLIAASYAKHRGPPPKIIDNRIQGFQVHMGTVHVITPSLARPASDNEIRTGHGRRPAVGTLAVKPHGRLVSVSSTPCSASTSDLSTSLSKRGLQGLAAGIPNLGVGFPLICFQRLSRPHMATRRCGWRHNRYTSGASDPVLSY